MLNLGLTRLNQMKLSTHQLDRFQFISCSQSNWEKSSNKKKRKCLRSKFLIPSWRRSNQETQEARKKRKKTQMTLVRLMRRPLNVIRVSLRICSTMETHLMCASCLLRIYHSKKVANSKVLWCLWSWSMLNRLSKMNSKRLKNWSSSIYIQSSKNWWSLFHSKHWQGLRLLRLSH